MLEVRHLNTWYGDAQALFDVHCSVDAGQLVVLQGLNGAGKSTLLASIMGLTDQSRRHSGTVRYENSIFQTADKSLPPHQRALAGLGYVAEDRRLFTALSVQENLRIAVRSQSLGGHQTGQAHSISSLETRALDLFPALKSMLKRPAAHMSGGEQQMLAIARTLMTAPRLLLLDEPCEGIAPVLIEAIVQALVLLKNQGMAMLVAEQNHLLADQADHCLQLQAGCMLNGN